MSPPDARHFLDLYLSDHHAGARGAIELARRCASQNAGNAIATFLTGRFLPEVEGDLRTLEDMMRLVGAKPRVYKDALAWVGEKLERLKLNGELTGYSPLSRVIELEALTLGVRGKRGGWVVLKAIAPTVSELSSLDFDALIARAESQELGLEGLKLEAARGAFG